MPRQQAPQPQTKRRQIIRVGAVVAIGVIVTAGLALNMPAIERQLGRWQLLPVSQPLSELYLKNATSLPKTYAPNQPMDVAFAIANRTGTSHAYRYRIVQTNSTGRETAVLLQNSVTVNFGYTANIEISLTPIDLGERSNIRIELTGTSLSTNFWLAKE